MTQKSYIKLTLIYILFIIYSTTIPFTFINSMDEFMQNLSSVRWMPYVTAGRFESLTDIFSNIFLFIPFGFFSAYLQRKSGKIILPVIFSLLTGLSLSLLIEILQLFTPERVSSITDICNNSLGAFFGSSIAVLYHNKISVFIKPYIISFFKHPLIEVYTVFTAVGIIFFSILPFDFSFDIGDLKQGVKFFLANLTLFPEWKYMQSSINNFIFFYLFSFFGALSILNRGLSWFTIKLFFLLSICFALAIECVQLMIISRSSSISNIVFAMSGSFSGIIIAAVYFYNKTDTLRTAERCFLIIYFCYILFNYMFPFKLANNITDKISVMSFVPFAMYFAKTNLFSYADFFEQTFMFIPLGLSGILNTARSWKKSFAVGFAFGGALELAQIFIADRYCDITDALMAGAGCFIGNYFFRKYNNFQNISNIIITNQ